MKIAAAALMQTSSKLFESLAGTGAKDFKGVLDGIRNASNTPGIGADSLQTDLQNLQSKILGSNQISTRDLLVYQIKAGELGMRVELLSKVADSLTTTVRKLQNNQ